MTRAAGWQIAVVSSLALWLALAGVVRAHDWYPWPCCNDQDCQMLPVEDVSLIDGVYVVRWGGQTVEYHQARPSPDGQYHICTSMGERQGGIMSISPFTTSGYEPGPCFWAPTGM